MYMKVTGLILFLLFISLLIAPSFVFAFDLDTEGMFKNSANKYGYDSATETTLSETIGKVVSGALALVGTLFLAFTIYAGILWLTARGDAEAVKKATDILKTSIIGIVVATSAFAITSFVLPQILKKTTGETGGSGSVGSVQGLVGCCEKCSESLQPGDPGCTRTFVDNQSQCQQECPLGSDVFNCYYSLKSESDCAQ